MSTRLQPILAAMTMVATAMAIPAGEALARMAPNTNQAGSVESAAPAMALGNGRSLNGRHVNGIRANGIRTNGIRTNGTRLEGAQSRSSAQHPLPDRDTGADGITLLDGSSYPIAPRMRPDGGSDFRFRAPIVARC